MMTNLKNYQITHDEDEADIIVVNSCTVTNDADKGVRNYISSKKHKKIIYTGCGFKANAEAFFEKSAVFGAFPHSKKERIAEFLNPESRFFEPDDIKAHIDSTIVSEFVGKSRAFIKIQEGCNFECSYCIIPAVRGVARSMREELILEQIELLVGNGFSEFILTGTNTGSYGSDMGRTLSGLIKKISCIGGVKRIRVGSLEPSQIDDEFLELLGEPFMAKHLHIALQHTSDRMLEVMRRKNRVKNDLALFQKIAEMGAALGTDYITGHPGESDEVWSEAYKAFLDFPLTHIHTFSYSDREGTHSSSLKDRPRGDVARERGIMLKDRVAQNNKSFREKKSPLQVLIEGGEDGAYEGFDQFFNKITIQSRKNIAKEWLEIEDYKIEDERNYAKIE